MELETDKAVVEVPSSVTGVVKEIKVKEGEKIKVGQVIFTLEAGASPSLASQARIRSSMFPDSMAPAWRSMQRLRQRVKPKNRRCLLISPKPTSPTVFHMPAHYGEVRLALNIATLSRGPACASAGARVGNRHP